MTCSSELLGRGVTCVTASAYKARIQGIQNRITSSSIMKLGGAAVHKSLAELRHKAKSLLERQEFIIHLILRKSFGDLEKVYKSLSSQP